MQTMCGHRQIFVGQCGPEDLKGWTPMSQTKNSTSKSVRSSNLEAGKTTKEKSLQCTVSFFFSFLFFLSPGNQRVGRVFLRLPAVGLSFNSRLFMVLLGRVRWLPAGQIAFWFALNREKLWARERYRRKRAAERARWRLFSLSFILYKTRARERERERERERDAC